MEVVVEFLGYDFSHEEFLTDLGINFQNMEEIQC
jgi:hypothetical protein